jgi:excisionase family DNA binding protein
MSASLIAIPLGDGSGRWIALPPETLREALVAAQTLGLSSSSPTSATPGDVSERWLTSEELQKLTGVHSTTWEAKAKAREVPSLRVGKALRFKLSEVEGAIRAGKANGT